MRVLVTGAKGLLSAAVTREFAAAGDVVALDRAALDVTDPDAIARQVAALRPDVVINGAAWNDVDGAEEDPLRSLEINAFAPRSLARAAAGAGAIFVHYSSDFVFDGETDRPYTEDDRPNPQGVYGAAKRLGELFALEKDAYVLRVESLFGPSPHASTRRGSLGTIVDRIRAGGDVPVFVDRVVSPSYTPHVARATRHLIERRAPRGLYHCVNEGHDTWAAIADRTAALMGLPFHPRPMTLATAALKARRPRYCALSNARAVSAGCDLPPWRTALAEFLDATDGR